MAKTFAACLDDIDFLQATYQFVGSNDDELSFNKGDVIVLTKQDDGGWWEGTLDGKIGWFPSNYCKAISADPEPVPETLPEDKGTKESSAYHSQVVENILQTQKKHLDELKGFLEKYLTPLKSSQILALQDRETICGNYSEIVDFHVSLDAKLEEESVKPIPKQRFGKYFLGIVNQMKELYFHYCSNHPRAASLIGNHGDELGEYMESLGAPNPGIMTLTSFLSKPFIHVEKYGNQIKELERHVQEDHIDNLDMKKATQILQMIALGCHEQRKKKEMELQMLTGTIDKWEGEPISTLGNLVHMGQVFVEKDDVGRRERYFCLFPNDLVTLSVSAGLVGYCFEEINSISNMSAKNVEDSEHFFNGFIITVDENEWHVMTSSPREKDAWMDALKKILGDKCEETFEVEAKKPSATNLERSDSKRSEVKSLPMLDIPNAAVNVTHIPRSLSTGATVNVKVGNNSRSNASSPIPGQEAGKPLSSIRASIRQPVRKEWSFTRLRPTPPYQQTGKTNDENLGESPKPVRRTGSSKNKMMVGGRASKEDLLESYSKKQASPNLTVSTNDDQQILEEDMMILSVIEAYCFSARTRQPLNLVDCYGNNDDDLLAQNLSTKSNEYTKKPFRKLLKDFEKTVYSSSDDEVVVGKTEYKSQQHSVKDKEGDKKESGFFRKRSQKKLKNKLTDAETTALVIDADAVAAKALMNENKVSVVTAPKKSQSLKLVKKNSLPLTNDEDCLVNGEFTKDGKLASTTQLKKSQSLKLVKAASLVSGDTEKKPSYEIGIKKSPRQKDVEKARSSVFSSNEKLNTRSSSSFRESIEKINRRFFQKQDSVEGKDVAEREQLTVFLPDGRLAESLSSVISQATLTNDASDKIRFSKENTDESRNLTGIESCAFVASPNADGFPSSEESHLSNEGVVITEVLPRSSYLVNSVYKTKDSANEAETMQDQCAVSAVKADNDVIDSASKPDINQVNNAVSNQFSRRETKLVESDFPDENLFILNNSRSEQGRCDADGSCNYASHSDAVLTSAGEVSNGNTFDIDIKNDAERARLIFLDENEKKIINERESSFGKKMLIKSCLCYSTKNVKNSL